METTMISHPKLRVRKVTGSEGPWHDPYSYEELHVSTPHLKIVLHTGLDCWMTVNGRERAAFCGMQKLSEDDRYRWYRKEQFPFFVGFTIEQIERIARKLNERCRKCGGRDFECVSGFPGETFEVCARCGAFGQSYFDRSAIE